MFNFQRRCYKIRCGFEIEGMIKSINIKEISNKEAYSLLTSAIVPRPVAFASTISKEGNVNLSPFSYFNVFSSNPPILVFSPVRRSIDNATKDTYDNIKEVPEVVINMVNYSIVQQMSLASNNYNKTVNEFVKSGLTEISSHAIRPPRVKESPISFECKVNKVIDLGTDGGAGSLVICEVIYCHIDTALLDEHLKINPEKLDAIARLGGNKYTRVTASSMFEILKPKNISGIGVDQLPEKFKEHFNPSELAQLATISELPIDISFNYSKEKLQKAKKWLKVSDVEKAWLALKH